MIDLSPEDIQLLTIILKERADRLHDALPDLSENNSQGWKDAAEILRLDTLRNKLNDSASVWCGLHEQKEPCSHCAIYRQNPHADDTGRGWDRFIA